MPVPKLWWPVLLVSLTLPLGAQGALREANDAAGVLVLERLRAEDAAAWQRLRKCPSSRILLVDGAHDHTDQVLRGLRIRFRSVDSGAFVRRPLHDVKLLIVDCPGKLNGAGARKVMGYVARGGTLLTTDWAVLHTLQRAGFGSQIRHNGRFTPDDVVRVSSVARHRFTRGVFPHGRHAAWWLENRSYPVDVLSDDVRVLFGSREMARRYDSSVLACTWTHGRGTVIHAVSHLYLQRNVHARPWERRSALDEADGLNLPTASKGFETLERAGTLGRVRAGDLNAALSVQQFLLNIILFSIEHRPPPRHEPVPPPRPPRPPRPPVTTGAGHEALRETSLRRAPGGTITLRVLEGLRLKIVRRDAGWALVRTPAGQEGWLPTADLGARRR